MYWHGCGNFGPLYSRLSCSSSRVCERVPVAVSSAVGDLANVTTESVLRCICCPLVLHFFLPPNPASRVPRVSPLPPLHPPPLPPLLAAPASVDRLYRSAPR